MSSVILGLPFREDTPGDGLRMLNPRPLPPGEDVYAQTLPHPAWCPGLSLISEGGEATGP